MSLLPLGCSLVLTISRSWKGHGPTAMTAIPGTIMSLLGFAFVDNAELVGGAIDDDTPGEGEDLYVEFRGLLVV